MNETGTNNPLVAIVIGSSADRPKIKDAQETLEALVVPYEVTVLSAHRTPERLSKYVEKACSSGVRVFIACAGLSAALPGAIASLTTLPVIGVPLSGSTLGGLEALLSIAQMPKGVPVATVGIDNAKNAGLLAGQILALTDKAIAERLWAMREEEKKKYDLP